MLEAIANGLGTLLQNSELSEELRTRTEESAVVDEIARILTATLEVDQVYERFALEVKRLVDFDRITINVVDKPKGTYAVKYTAGLDIPARRVGVVRFLEGTLTEQMILTQQTVVRPDLSTSQYRGTSRDAGLRSGIASPLISNGRVVGTLSLLSMSLDAYSATSGRRVIELWAAENFLAGRQSSNE